MIDQPKLLPCPFCGYTNSVEHHLRRVSNENKRGHVGCMRCGIELPFEFWNKRAPDHEREAMARVCEAAVNHEVIRKLSSHYVEYEESRRVLQDALADLGRARKGEG